MHKPYGAFVLAWLITASTAGAAQAPATPTVVARFAAMTANLKGSPDSVRIDVFAWSPDTARNQLVDAWNLMPPAPGTAATGTAAGGRGAAGARGARGGARSGNVPETGTTEDASAPAAATAPPAARGARGTRGSRGGPPAGPAVDNPGGSAAGTRDTPEKSLAAALQSAGGVGYLWTSESTGYSLRYAYRLTQPDGGERIILATDRRLGDRDESWKPAAGTSSDYAFSIIELRLNGRHEGEGKASVTGKIAVDRAANTVALEDYAALPVTLKDVKPRNAN